MPNSNLGKISVAIVDDHEPFRVATCALLKARGFTTVSYGCVKDFIHSGSMARIQCLILDVGMPEIDGFALQECLRDTNYEFPIIFCTGQDSDEAKNRALTNGAVYFLRKPVDSDALITAICSACNLPPLAPRAGKSSTG